MSGLQALGDAIVVLRNERDTLRAEVDSLIRQLRIEQADTEMAFADMEIMRAEVERLRRALRSVIVAAGGSAAPDVSTEFLEQAPLEVLALRGKAEKLERIANKAMARLKEQIK